MLRIVAMLAVIVTHTCAGAVKSMDVWNESWLHLNLLHSAITWHVPVFVMISGGIFLNPSREIPITVLYRKYVMHLLICLIVWSGAFQVYYFLTNSETLNWKGMVSETLVGAYPFWYLWMLIGLYMIIPFLRSFAQDRKLVRYFLALFLISQFLVNYGAKLPGVGSTIDQIIGKSNFHFALGFTGYYLLGHYLLGSKIPLKKEILLYVLGIGCVIFTCTATTWQSRIQGVFNEWFSKYLMPNVIIESAALFVFFTKRVSRIRVNQRVESILKNLSTLGFGVYLVHGLVLEVFGRFGITVVGATPVLATLLQTVVIYAISLGLTWTIRKIPVIGKNIT